MWKVLNDFAEAHTFAYGAIIAVTYAAAASIMLAGACALVEKTSKSETDKDNR